MLQLAKLTDYAVLVITYMAKQPSAIYNTTQLASIISLPLPTVRKLLKMLVTAKLVDSTRGSKGGYTLSRCHITLSEVITAVEGACAITACCDPLATCYLESRCLVSNNWKKINSVILKFLNTITISDLSKPLALREISRD